MKIDLEVFRDLVLDTLKAGMTAKVAQINALKADSITISTIPADDFYPVSNQIVDREVWIAYEIREIETNAQGFLSVIEPTINVLVVTRDTGKGISVMESILYRYERVLREIITDNLQDIKNNTNLQLIIAPYPIGNWIVGDIPFDDKEIMDVGANLFKVIGIAVTTKFPAC